MKKSFFKFFSQIKSLTILIVITLIVGGLIGSTLMYFFKKTNINNINIISQAKEISELAVMEYNYSDADVFEDSKTIKLFGKRVKVLGTAKIICLSWNGTIKTGIDYNEVKVDINNKSKTIKISLPEVEILDHYIDVGSIQILYEKDEIWSKIESDDALNFVNERKEETEKEYLEKGILNTTLEKVEEIFESVYKSYYNDYTVEFETE